MNPSGRPPVRAERLLVFSGADIGTGYVRQLLRAVAAGALHTAEIVVLDRDPHCEAGGIRDPLVRLEVSDWGRWLDAHAASLDPLDQLVPYHWAPHLFFEWLAREARRAGAVAERVTPPEPHGLPMVRLTRAGDTALSYATWLCPPTCIEPVVCPHTRQPKDWSLAQRLGAATEAGADAALVLGSFHFVWGVATIPAARLLEARQEVLAGLSGGRRRYLVATASHCHGLAAGLEITPPAATCATGGCPTGTSPRS